MRIPHAGTGPGRLGGVVCLRLPERGGGGMEHIAPRAATSRVSSTDAQPVVCLGSEPIDDEAQLAAFWHRRPRGWPLKDGAVEKDTWQSQK